jgi:hypothetical protein
LAVNRHGGDGASAERSIAQQPAALGWILDVVNRMACVVNDVVISQTSFNERHIDGIALEVDAKDVPSLVEKISQRQSFTISRLKITAWIGKD